MEETIALLLVWSEGNYILEASMPPFVSTAPWYTVTKACAHLGNIIVYVVVNATIGERLT